MIIYVVPELHSPGGIQEFAKLVYSQLKNDYDIKLMDWKPSLSLFSRGILHYSPTTLKLLYYSRFLTNKYKKKYKEIENSDFVHFWHIEPAFSFLDKKYVVTCHGMEILPANVKYFREVSYQKVLSNASLIHANSNYTKSLVLGLLKEGEVVVIPPPINFKKFSTINKIEKNKVIIGTLTRFVKRKNVPNIIKALNLLKEKYNVDFKYHLAGDGLEKKRIISELREAKFEWQYFGKISEEDKINKFYPSLDVFVLPPLELPNDVEGFGIVYLEANSYGIPVVASRAGGVPDAVKEGISGMFANPENPEDIAIKILELLRNKKNYKNSTREWAKRFDIKKIAKKFAEMYDRVL